eukprot:130909-Chlamydomonas_euryale.AAC.2
MDVGDAVSARAKCGGRGGGGLARKESGARAHLSAREWREGALALCGTGPLQIRCQLGGAFLLLSHASPHRALFCAC